MADLQSITATGLFGSPCRITKDGNDIYGRYIGDSNLKCTDDVVILVGTPCNSIIHTNRSSACFDTTATDLRVLKDFENDAIEKNEWYHKSRPQTELDKIGVFISPGEISPIEISEE